MNRNYQLLITCEAKFTDLKVEANRRRCYRTIIDQSFRLI
jgi:hypothetical protein